MRHSREEVIDRTILEFALLDNLVGGLRYVEWRRWVRRAAGEDPWTVKDALVHIAYWKADAARFALGRRRPPDVRGLSTLDHNHLVYERWRDRSPEEVRAWHRQVQEEVLAALKEAPEAWFNGREREAEWPLDLDGHSASHRVRDMERVVKR